MSNAFKKVGWMKYDSNSNKVLEFHDKSFSEKTITQKIHELNLSDV